MYLGGTMFLVYHGGTGYHGIKISRESVVIFGVCKVWKSVGQWDLGYDINQRICSGYLGITLPMAISGLSG